MTYDTVMKSRLFPVAPLVKGKGTNAPDTSQLSGAPGYFSDLFCFAV